MSPKDNLDEPFVNICNNPSGHDEKSKDFYKHWVEHASAPYTSQEKLGYEMLKKSYPKHSIVMTDDRLLNVLRFPRVLSAPLESSPLLTNLAYIPGMKSQSPGVLADQVRFGGFTLAWDQYDFLLFIVTWPSAYGWASQHYILHEGPDEPTRLLMLSAGKWANELHEEVWIFDGGFWEKDHGLWTDIQKGNWDDVILEPQFKKSIKKDIYGFWTSESVYKSLGVPWKRGVIMYGPPGNGKTISLKVIMKECYDKGFTPLYVKSFQSWMGEEGAMQAVFGKARELAPCVIVLEDLDSLVNEGNRSYFLNQLDGLSGNDGLLIIATTNHFDRLDPGLSSRPSRFDRKYLFDDPTRHERRLYCRYWQDKLVPNPDVSYPNGLADEVSDMTENFSFAYLKEAHVSTLVTLAGAEPDERESFSEAIKKQIKDLRAEMGKQPFHGSRSASVNSTDGNTRRDIRFLLDSLSEAGSWQDPTTGRTFRSTPSSAYNGDIGGKDVRNLLDALPNQGIEAQLARIFDRTNTYDGKIGGRDIRVVLDALSEDREGESPLRHFIGQPGIDSASPAERDHRYRELLDRLANLTPVDSSRPIGDALNQRVGRN